MIELHNNQPPGVWRQWKAGTRQFTLPALRSHCLTRLWMSGLDGRRGRRRAVNWGPSMEGWLVKTDPPSLRQSATSWTWRTFSSSSMYLIASAKSARRAASGSAESLACNQWKLNRQCLHSSSSLPDFAKWWPSSPSFLRLYLVWKIS